MQAFGGVFGSRVVAVLLSSLLFALAHGIGQDLPIFVDRFAFGLVAGVLVILTGGLEAGIAMHVLNNFLAFGLALAFTDMSSALNPTGGTWWSLPGTLTQSLVYLVLATWLARRMGSPLGPRRGRSEPRSQGGAEPCRRSCPGETWSSCSTSGSTSKPSRPGERFADHSRETFDGVLGLSERLATDLFAPHNRAADLEEPRWDGQQVHLLPEVKKAVDAYAAADLLRLGFDAEHGGLQLPTVVSVASGAGSPPRTWAPPATSRSPRATPTCWSSTPRPSWSRGSCRRCWTGRFLGTMALSEPQAGSNLADITTRAVPQDDGTYRVFGQKMWISAGDHELADNIVHLVLAKIPGGPPAPAASPCSWSPRPSSTEDGSLGERNDVVLTGINHKMGWRGTVNTAPSFGSGAFTPGGEPGAVGYLVGEPHRGLSYMFTMMNEARIGGRAVAAPRWATPAT